MGDERGQALVLLLGGLAAVLIGAFVLGAIAQGVGAKGGAQRAADLGALAGARAMQDGWPRLFEPPLLAGRPNPAPPLPGRVPRARARARRSRPRGPTARRRRAPPLPPTTASEPRASAWSSGGASRSAPAVRARASTSRRPLRRSSPWAPAPRRPARRAATATAVRSPTGRASRCAPTPRGRSTACPRRPLRMALSCSSPAATAATPSRRSSTAVIRIRNGSRRRGSRCTASAPSSTSARLRRTAGWPRTRGASASSSATRGSPGTTGWR